ncbi:MAG TPA: zf-HC2 domain-containing protein [Candidatus Dormibacteraeota bacterium]|nr:zf-HC2 domain-containing protein [Candidatus Dormibacteraeota bacterium]
MSCEKISNALMAYLDGRASAQERSIAEAHLKVCAACQERAEEFRRLWQVMAEVPAVEPSLAFDARVRQRIAAAPRPKFWAWMMPAPRFAVSVALLVVLSIWIGGRQPRSVNPQIATANSEEQFRMIKDLGVLENYDVLSNFDALSDLPASSQPRQAPQQSPQENLHQGNGPGSGSGA